MSAYMRSHTHTHADTPHGESETRRNPSCLLPYGLRPVRRPGLVVDGLTFAPPPGGPAWWPSLRDADNSVLHPLGNAFTNPYIHICADVYVLVYLHS